MKQEDSNKLSAYRDWHIFRPGHQSVEKLRWLYFIADDYARSTITNIYFDNDDFQMIQDSLFLAKVCEKLRMRTWRRANSTDDCQVFLEIKKKSEEVGFKYRLSSNPVSVVNFIEKWIS